MNKNMKETWKDIDGYEGIYQVSSLGNVKRISTGRTLKPRLNEKGYGRVVLYKNNTKKQYRIHRLVAQHFIKNSNKYNEVNHLDLNKINNRVDNLEWCTRQENMRHASKNVRWSDNNPLTKLDHDKVALIRYLFDYKIMKQYKIATMLSVSKTCIRCVVHRKTWKIVDNEPNLFGFNLLAPQI